MRTERLRRWAVNLGWVAAFALVAVLAYVGGRSAGLNSRPDPEPSPEYVQTDLPAQGDVVRTQAGFTGFEAGGLLGGKPLLFGQVTGVRDDVLEWAPILPYTEGPEVEVTAVEVDGTSGALEIALANGSRLRALRAGSIADIVAGSRIAVIGEVDGDTVTATAVLIVLPEAQVAPQPAGPPPPPPEPEEGEAPPEGGAPPEGATGTPGEGTAEAPAGGTTEAPAETPAATEEAGSG